MEKTGTGGRLECETKTLIGLKVVILAKLVTNLVITVTLYHWEGDSANIAIC